MLVTSTVLFDLSCMVDDRFDTALPWSAFAFGLGAGDGDGEAGGPSEF
jgi:hypothetical protein